ncbi:MAG TPA: hypothetical protein PKA35_06605 [Paracoccus solventivorans]|jgi:hypothetical protein|uniref:hypothetical protein n=1 Tax=Paracoccaceae TaxID=31989 RepID=UPI002B8A97E2|nr:hypothetical protein [Paracoccus solventivorans]HMM08773.1 hypothetical protein [Paracoccus solventivorans]
MSFDRMRLYDAGRFHDTELPDWYHAAMRLSEAERVDWHRALERVLDCEYTLLTEEGLISAGLEIRFWPSEMQGIFVLIETPLAVVEQIVILNPTDWLPFLSRYLAPLMAASNQSAMIALHGKIGNAFIAWARHGEGSHVDRETGLSRIDLDNDRDRRRAQQARATIERASREGSA